MTTITQNRLDPLLAEPPPRPSHLLRRIVVYGLLFAGVALVLVPFLWMVSTSLKTQEQLFVRGINFIPNPAVPGNYLEVWNRLLSINPQMTFWRIMGNTLFITVLAMIGEITSASLVAYGFSRFSWRGRDALFAVMLATIMIPGIVTRVPGFLIWRQLGLLDTYDPLTWPALFAWGPIYVFLMRQFFNTIPREIEEAAVMDGANVIQVFVHIMLPLIKPILLAIAVLSFQGNWNNFQGPLLYLTTPEKFPLALSMRFFDQSLSKEAPQWQYMMSMATMMAAPILLLYFVAQKYFIEGISVGAVKGMIMRVLFLLTGLLLMAGVTVAQDDLPAADLVNLDHLQYLTEPVTVDGREMAIVHIYSEYPDYDWVDDADEGISAVDDVARAAVVYLWEYERTGDAELLDWARRCLDFVRYMQADDGEFYNFVFTREGEINERGGTSYKSLGWWAMRALWSLGEGVRVFNDVDPAYADDLAEAYQRTESAVAATMSNYGQYITLHGIEIPAWIPASEPDIAAIGLLGMSAYYQARPNETTFHAITKIATAIALYRVGTDSMYPFGMHPTNANAPGFWHDWSAHMPHALVMAGMALGRQDWIDSAAAEANSFLLRQLAFERFRHIGVVPYRLEQIAYGTNMLVQAYTSLYAVTGEERYAQLAALAGSWYFGNNMADTQMYYPDSGRTYDGINGPVAWRVNRNSGAESTIEGLMSMSALARLPESVQPLLHATTLDDTLPILLQAEDGERVIGTPVYYSGTWTGEGYISAGRYVGLGEGQRMRLTFTLDEDQADEYLVYVAHVRQAANSSAFLIPRADAPPTIDGNDADWDASVPVLAADTAGQLLRGGGLWSGAEVDSHAVRLTWDDENLYLLADVRDPEHVQDATVSGVWQGDTLWLYFTSGDMRALDAKLTLAQTPQGGQVWDWLHARFARGAEVVWQAMDEGGGYTYEAAIPWAALDIDEPQAGMRLGFEAGRGLGGNSFMDLTGRDPDVAANLLQLTLTVPGMDASLGAAANVALNVRLDREDEFTLQESVSPDTDHFWLDLVTPQALRLEAGEHTIRYEYAGDEGTGNPGISKVDAFYLQPLVGRRVYQLPDGTQLTLTYNTLTGDSDLLETTP